MATKTTQRPAARQSAILAIVLVSYFMVVLDNSIIFTAIPQIASALELSPTTLSWVQDAYTLVFGGLLLLGARSGDILGRQRVFVAGLALFGFASFLVGSAQSAEWMIAARALQGVGAAIVAPSSLALITASFAPGRERTKAVAAYGTTAGLGASFGMLVGGAFAELISWRAGFFINVPIAAVTVFAAFRYLPKIRPVPGKFDALGALSSTIGMGSLVFGIVESAERGWSSPVTLGAIAVGLVALAFFVRTETRAAQPILPLRISASRQGSGAAVARLLFAGAMIAFFFFTSQFLQDVYGWTSLQAGAAFLPLTLPQFAVALAVPRLTRRFGNTALVVVGLSFVLTGFVALAQIVVTSPYLTAVAIPMVLIGIGQGFAFGPLTAAGLAGAAPEDAGAASGLVNTAHQLGSTFGVAILTAVSAGAPTLADRVADAYQGGIVLMALAVTAVLVCLVPSAVSQRRTLASVSN